MTQNKSRGVWDASSQDAPGRADLIVFQNNFDLGPRTSIAIGAIAIEMPRASHHHDRSSRASPFLNPELTE